MLPTLRRANIAGVHGVSSATVGEMLAGFAAAGIDTEDLCRRAQIDPALLDDPFAYFPQAIAGALLLHAHAARPSGDAGLCAAMVDDPRELRALTFLFVTAPTVGAAFEAIVRFHDAISTFVSYSIEQTPGARRVQWRSHGLSGLLELIVRDVSTAAAIRRLRDAVPGFEATVELRGPALADRSRYREVFGDRVAFDQPETTFVISNRVWDLPMPSRNDALHDVLREHGERFLERAPTRGLVLLAQSRLAGLLTEGDATAGRLARELGVSQRTLQRRLRAEGAPFSELLRGTRLALARLYLRDVTLSLEDVSALLGYAEHRSFTRAFRSWTGESPSQYRRAHVAIGEDSGAS